MADKPKTGKTGQTNFSGNKGKCPIVDHAIHDLTGCCQKGPF
jgi:hypothetical protein